jgi:hypothetical protein
VRFGALLDAQHGGCNAVIVALSIMSMVIVYFGVVWARVARTGTSTGGPNVFPP